MTRLILTILLAILCSAVAYAAEETAFPFEKIGPNGEIYIQNAEQLANIQGLATMYIETEGRQGTLDYLTCPDKHYVLNADIDLPVNWTPIGDVSSNPAFLFRGSLDGSGHTIRGLLIDINPCAIQGLFGKIEGASISNLILKDAAIRLEGCNPEITAGLLAGEAVSSRFKNITIANGTISAKENQNIYDADSSKNKAVGAIGALAGRIADSMVESVTVTVNIDTSSAIVGGLAGNAIDTRFYHSGVDEGEVIGQGIVGGFAGRLEGTGPVLGCHSNADATGAIAGGFIGQIIGPSLPTNANHALEIFQNKATGKAVSTMGIAEESAEDFAYAVAVSSAKDIARGIAGGFAGEISYVLIRDCSAYGDVIGGSVAGGFIGGAYNRSRVIYGYAKGNVSGQSTEYKGPGGALGGFAGEIASAACIEFSYSSGAVIGERDWEGAVGGFVGIVSDVGSPNTITHCLSFAPWVVGGQNNYVHRFAGRTLHQGVNGCYAYLGSQVVRGGSLAHVVPSAYGIDGGDMSGAQVEVIAGRLGWRANMLP